MLQLPLTLQQLLAAGRWPRNHEEAKNQDLKPLVSVECIKRLAPEEHSLYLFPPPFATVAEHAVDNKFWLDKESAPSEIEFELALYIGDFGLGSDSSILLDYRADRVEPRVLRLRWSNKGQDNHWIEAAPNFEAFARILGLLS
jgi:hypothetical protein